MYHYDYTKKFSGKTYRQSVELPIYWLIYYDSVSRVVREPTETYSFKLFSVPYLILPDRGKKRNPLLQFLLKGSDEPYVLKIKLFSRLVYD